MPQLNSLQKKGNLHKAGNAKPQREKTVSAAVVCLEGTYSADITVIVLEQIERIAINETTNPH